MLPYYDMLPYLDSTMKDFHINNWLEPLDWPAHLHSQVELIYVRKGALEVTINTQTRIMQKGDFAVAFPNCIHSYSIVPGYEQDVDVAFYIFNRHLAGDYADKLKTCVAQSPFVGKEQMTEDAYIALERLLLQQGEGYHPSIAKSYLQILLACTWSQMQPEKDETRDHDLPYQVLKYVLDHFRQPITVESTAKELCVSKNYLSCIFTQKLHMTFHQYLHFLRIEMARDLLRNTDQSITTILYECGYESPRTFNRVFQDICGVTPREYRQQFQNQ